ncbi:MAG: hydantoinase/oxoprolinase family protein [Anaerolineae bacterium]|nr:hydantoinase/oxoprolinase family protein [Anaerolineae bacterium]
MRIGIDVGGTNTDAVLMDGQQIIASTKTPTTPNVSDGIIAALKNLVADSGVDVATLDGVMIGTTHFTNAVVERRRLQTTACIRLGLPATVCLPPMVDWPDDLREVVGGHYYMAHGGHEFDGREISAFEPAEIRQFAEDIGRRGINAIAISSVFSPVNVSFEERAAAIVREVLPDAHITLSSTIGRIGLLERENAAIMNACLRELAIKTVGGFKAALAELKITAPFYISQNDGTLMNADFATDHPVLTFASGPTNSMRGAAFLSGLKDAIVIDVGGTTTDVGVLQHGFPRVAALAVSIGGVRTNFRMPDTLSIGLGGGSLVVLDPLKVGPQSVGYEITSKALVFGGDVLTTTDIAVAGGKADVGDAAKVAHIDKALISAVEDRIEEMVNIAVDRMKTSAALVPVVVVGGGSILIQRQVSGASEIIKPGHFAVANAIGAAIAQIGGETDRIFSLAEMTREKALELAKQEASDRAVAAGADARSIEIVEVEEVPLAYLPGNATRIMVKAVGDLAAGR